LKKGDIMSEQDFGMYKKKSGSLFKWLVILAIIIAAVWYLNNQGYIDLSSLSLNIPGLG